MAPCVARSPRPLDKGSSPCMWPASSFILRPPPGRLPSLRHKPNLLQPHSDLLPARASDPQTGSEGAALDTPLTGSPYTNASCDVVPWASRSRCPSPHPATRQRSRIQLHGTQASPSLGHSLMGLPEVTPGSTGPARDWSNCSVKPQNHSYSHFFHVVFPP